MSKVFIGLFLVAVAFVSNAATTPSPLGWWEDSPWRDPERGFNWYPDPEKPKVKKEEKKPETAKPKTIYEMDNFEDIHKELKKIREAAILNPSEKNVYDYLKAQAWIMEKSAVFADTARRVVWASPDVDYNNKSPVTTMARSGMAERRSHERKGNIEQLSQTHGLLWFARSDCPYCHDQASIIKVFERSYNLPVLTVSMDGGPIPMFPEAKPDNGISSRVTKGAGVEIVPALYLINRSTFEAIPLGSGVIAAEELAERIRVLTRTKPGEEF